jgi:hypothetical protein
VHHGEAVGQHRGDGESGLVGRGGDVLDGVACRLARLLPQGTAALAQLGERRPVEEVGPHGDSRLTNRRAQARSIAR